MPQALDINLSDSSSDSESSASSASCGSNSSDSSAQPVTRLVHGGASRAARASVGKRFTPPSRGNYGCGVAATLGGGPVAADRVKVVTASGRAPQALGSQPTRRKPKVVVRPTGDDVAPEGEVPDPEVVARRQRHEDATSTTGPVVYRSDAGLWPPGVQGVPLDSAQRTALARIATVCTPRLRACQQDLAEAEAMVTSYKRTCAGKTEVEAFCEELRQEAERAASKWRERVTALRSTWGEAAATQDARTSGSPEVYIGVRPHIIRGERWYCAYVRGPRGKLFGPLRTTRQAAAEDHARLVQATTGANPRAATPAAAGAAAPDVDGMCGNAACETRTGGAAKEVDDGGRVLCFKRRRTVDEEVSAG